MTDATNAASRKQAKRSDKIFINYRRQDTAGFAGRLTDCLADYFGSDRVFRDVTDIDYGDDFEQAIERKLEESGALVVVIGERWTSLRNDSGERRLDDPSDWVSREIEIALERGIPIVPVLIGDTVMPGKAELPEKLHRLARHNALTIADERWAFDVERLAKVLAIDVPGTVVQRRLTRFRGSLTLLLLAAVSFAVVAFCGGVYRALSGGSALLEQGYPPIIAVLPFLPIVAAGTLAISMAPLIEKRSRRYVWAAVAVATIGCLAPFIFYTLYNNTDRTLCLIVNFGGSAIAAVGMLALVTLSGFRPR